MRNKGKRQGEAQERPPAKSKTAERIKQVRRTKGVTQSALAQMTGKARTTLAQYESGAIEPPLDALKSIATALEVSPEYLAFGAGDIGVQRTTHVGPSIQFKDPTQVPPELLAISGTSSATLKLAPIFARSVLVRLEQDAPAFELSAAEDVLLVDFSTKKALPDRRLYLLRSTLGLQPMRCEPALGRTDVLRFLGPDGQTYEVTPDEVTVEGVVVGSVKIAPGASSSEDS